MNKLFCSLILFGILGNCTFAWAERPAPPLRSEMHRIYGAYKELYPYLYSREAFVANDNDQRLKELLKQISTGFHHVEVSGTQREREPGFASTLKVTSGMIDDAKNRFNEGNKDYSLWRLRTAATSCVSCHTRYKISADFSDTEIAGIELTPLQRGEFLIATRQFEKARQVLKQSISSEIPPQQKFVALRRWLIIAVRVQPRPKAAANELRAMKASGNFLKSDEREIDGWIQSLDAWDVEKSPKVPELVAAENLIHRGTNFNSPANRSAGGVDLLRATALLHGLLDGKQIPSQDRRHALYLLGLAYSELPFFFVNELPESFLELCIMENPATDDARKAFRLYEARTIEAFTGSSGTHVPDDESLKLKTLHDQAFGVPHIENRAAND